MRQVDQGVLAPSLIHRVPSTDLPTHFRVNKFTSAFQAIISAYGVASYKEVNPGMYVT